MDERRRQLSRNPSADPIGYYATEVRSGRFTTEQSYGLAALGYNPAAAYLGWRKCTFRCVGYHAVLPPGQKTARHMWESILCLHPAEWVRWVIQSDHEAKRLLGVIRYAAPSEIFRRGPAIYENGVPLGFTIIDEHIPWTKDHVLQVFTRLMSRGEYSRGMKQARGAIRDAMPGILRGRVKALGLPEVK